MCGLIGYAGIESAAKKVFDGLLKLEYRGYDSAGICCLCEGEFRSCKKVGVVNNLAPYVSDLLGNIAIGHTRWATHGEVSERNAHPHIGKNFAVVHNGIIENYLSLKKWLLQTGAEFLSETDSEVVVHLLEYYYSHENDFLRAVTLAASRLKGSYALLIACRDSDKICVVRYKSPVLVGVGADGYYAASDPVALVGSCEYAYRIKDGEIALISDSGISLLDAKSNAVVPPFEKLDIDASCVDTGGYTHYMLKEITECPSVVEKSARIYFTDCIDAVKNIAVGVEKIILLGCGTAYNAGLVGKIFFEETARIPCSVEIASELRYSNPIVDVKTLVIAISQSGETADTVEATKLMKSLGAKIIAVTSVPYSVLTCYADVVVPVVSGKEICVAATKSYCGQIASLYCICSTLVFGDGVAIENLVKISSEMRVGVDVQKQIKGLAAKCAKSSAVFFLGRGRDFAVAEEASLKLKEVSYLFCDGYACGELKHGTLALIDENTLSIVIMSDEANVEKCLNSVEQILSRKGKVAIVTTVPYVKKVLPQGVEECILLSDYAGALSPLLTSVALQYLAYYTAVDRGLNPDKPRNLAKSVTVE